MGTSASPVGDSYSIIHDFSNFWGIFDFPRLDVFSDLGPP